MSIPLGSRHVNCTNESGLCRRIASYHGKQLPAGCHPRSCNAAFCMHAPQTSSPDIITMLRTGLVCCAEECGLCRHEASYCNEVLPSRRPLQVLHWALLHASPTIDASLPLNRCYRGHMLSSVSHQRMPFRLSCLSEGPAVSSKHGAYRIWWRSTLCRWQPAGWHSAQFMTHCPRCTLAC